MLKEYKKFIATSLYFTDIAVTVLSVLVTCLIHSSYHLSQVDLNSQNPLSPTYYYMIFFIIPVWSFLLYYHKAYHSYRTIPFTQEIMVIGKTVLQGGLIIVLTAFITQPVQISRIFIIMFIVINLALLSVERIFIRLISRYIREKGYNFRRIIIVGTEEASRDVVNVIEKNKHWGLKILGFINDDPHVTRTQAYGYNILGNLSGIQDIIRKEAIDEVIFAVTRKRFDELEDTFLMLEDHGVNARVVFNFFPQVVAKVSMEDLDNIPLLTFSTIPSNTFAMFAKRLLDVAVSLLLMLITSPVMLVTAFLVKATSSGPILFRQKRCGLNGRVFMLYKFRSMISDAEEKKKGLEERNEMVGPAFKIKDDPRVTGVGRFIRNASIDELPQLWNVLKGDMSIVGPRPPLLEEVAEYARWQRRKLSMKPGLTCLWQVNGRNKVRHFDDWARLDLQYIDKWSLKLDLMIFLKTVGVVLFRKGAA